MNLAELTKMNEEQSRLFFESLRWPKGPRCVHCKSKRIIRLNGKKDRAGLFLCNKCRQKFTATVGTIMEDSHLPIRKWLIAFHMMCASKKGVSALQIKRQLGVTYKTAWFLAHRIRHAMRAGSAFRKLRGKVEVDETYVGGKTRLGIPGRGSERKTPVMALVERDGRIRNRVVERVNGETLKGAIREMVDKRSTIMTDEWAAYTGIGKEFKGGHKVVNHARKEYVRGDVYTNTAESYFALLKRGVHGTFHHISKKHLPRYCDEFSFRWNSRKVSDGERMVQALLQVDGKRLTYNPLCN
jgi:transposase-like protein